MSVRFRNFTPLLQHLRRSGKAMHSMQTDWYDMRMLPDSRDGLKSLIGNIVHFSCCSCIVCLYSLGLVLIQSGSEGRSDNHASQDWAQPP